MDTYRDLLTKKTTADRQHLMTSFHEFEEIIGVPHCHELERRFAAQAG